LKTILIFIALTALGACGPADETGDETADAGSDTTQSADTTADDTTADSGVGDATETDAGEDTQSDADDTCNPDALAAEQVAVNESVNDGEVSVANENGVQTVTLDASSGGVSEAAQQSFIYIDLDEPGKLALSDADAFEDTTWDIAVRRTVIRINGGDSGPGNWLLTAIDDGWSDASMPGRDAEWSTDNFVTDSCELVQTERGSIITAFGQWYDYNPQTHEVSAPENTTWALYNSSTHSVIKLGIAAYDSATYDIRIGSFGN
jgi:hypothetical protein